MTHLKIIQNNTLADTEEVSQEIIQKLYDLVVSGDLDASSEMKGRLHLLTGYRTQMEYLHQMFPNLIISIDEYIIPFEDPKMVTYLNSIGVGSNGVITEADAAAATIVANSLNTEVTKFNELKYFTGITESKNGWEGSSSGIIRFYNWTALEEVDISNFTSLGHNNGYAWDDTFKNCTSLKKVIASSKLNAIGYNAFFGCTNLEKITNLSGVITLSGRAFTNNQKLLNSTFADVEILFSNYGWNGNEFENTKLITSLTLSPTNTFIPENCFKSCSNLEEIIGLSGTITINNQAFYDCEKLKSSSFDNVEILFSNGGGMFRGCKALSSVNLSNSNTKIPPNCFYNSGITSITLPTSITTINDWAFRDCVNLTAIDISHITSLGPDAFNNCKNLQVNDLSSIATAGAGAFIGCSNLCETLTLPNLTTLGNGAFGSITALKHVTDLGSITSVGKINDITHGPFDRCVNLEDIVIPNSVTYIHKRTFYNCRKLEWIKMLPTTPPNADSTAFENVTVSGVKLYVPDASLSAYQNDSYWGAFDVRAFSTFTAS